MQSIKLLYSHTGTLMQYNVTVSVWQVITSRSTFSAAASTLVTDIGITQFLLRFQQLVDVRQTLNSSSKSSTGLLYDTLCNPNTYQGC